MNVYVGKDVGTKTEFFICIIPSYFDEGDKVVTIDSVGEPVFDKEHCILYKIKQPIIIDFTLRKSEGHLDIHRSKTGFITTLDNDIIPLKIFDKMIKYSLLEGAEK